MNVLITGSKGFIGTHLKNYLKDTDVTLLEFCREDSLETLEHNLQLADVIYHLAGVNRPASIDEYERVNVGLTKKICSILDKLNRKPKIVFTSSIQAISNTPYGVSKKKAEDLLFDFGERNNTATIVYRLQNVFGPGCKPNYNSVVATFCYNVANNIPIWMSDPERELNLVYVHDVVQSLVQDLVDDFSRMQLVVITLKELAQKIRLFHDIQHIVIKNEFDAQLYATYLSYVSEVKS